MRAKKLKDNNGIFMPITSTQAVKTPNGTSLQSLLDNVNSVQANPTIPSGTETTALESLKVGNTYYTAPSGSSGGSSGGGGTLYEHKLIVTYSGTYDSSDWKGFYISIINQDETPFDKRKFYQWLLDNNFTSYSNKINVNGTYCYSYDFNEIWADGSVSNCSIAWNKSFHTGYATSTGNWLSSVTDRIIAI